MENCGLCHPEARRVRTKHLGGLALLRKRRINYVIKTGSGAEVRAFGSKFWRKIAKNLLLCSKIMV
jgi:hypothetical protein